MREKSLEEKMAIRVGKKLIRKRKRSDQFVWWKKIERDIRLGRLTPSSSEKKRFKAEIEKLKKRRDERAVEKARREEEMMMLQRQRLRADADAHLFEKKECRFILDQFKAKSRIRFYQGRIKPIDILTLNYEFDDLELKEPCMIFKGLSVSDIEELRSEIELRLDCLHRIADDGDEYRSIIQFWEALMVVSDWELAQRKRDKQSGGRGRILHPNIETDVTSFLQGIQSYDELIELEARIESDMRAGKSKVVEFWEVVLRHIHVYKAKAFLKDFHHKHKLSMSKSKPKSKSEEEKIQEDYKDVRAIEDRQEDLDFEARAMKKVMEEENLEEGESVLGCSAEVKLESRWNWWHDIYRPRKPKYLIKYHTGYVWNQYNRTHYDKQNPPPQFIQGYKFNIFYPHLIDQTTTPQCFIDTDTDTDKDTDTCVLRFHAGPPYEDIAFRIPNKEWECSRKKGFKCTFEGGILRLYFNFKRFHYRR